MGVLFLFFVSLASASEVPNCHDLHRKGHRQVRSQREYSNPIRSTLWLGLRFYQKVISPADGATCTMFPSCSQYAIESIQRNGPVLGLWMSSARIVQNHQDATLERCAANGTHYYYSPPQHAEWWLE